MSKTTEIAIFQVDKENHQKLGKIQKPMEQWMKEQEGFLSWERQQSVENPEIFVDIVLWEDTMKAKNAAEKMMSTPLGEEFGSLIAKIIQFDHFQP